MLAKATAAEDDVRLVSTSTITPITSSSCTISIPISHSILPIPSLPKVQLPPILSPPITITSNIENPPQQVPLPLVVNDRKSLSANSSVGPVGCLIIEPQLFAADACKNGFSLTTSNTALALTTTSIAAAKSNPPLITKLRKVQPSTQQTPISYASTSIPSAPRARKVISTPSLPSCNNIYNNNNKDIEVISLLQANRELDSTCLFFLSLAKTVRNMPTKYQSLVKMRCMRIVSDIELELENYAECNGIVAPPADGNYFLKYPTTLSNTSAANERQPNHNSNAEKNNFTSSQTESSAVVTNNTTMTMMHPSSATSSNVPNESTEHFLYVMSPSRVESMIDISSEDEADAPTRNGN